MVSGELLQYVGEDGNREILQSMTHILGNQLSRVTVRRPPLVIQLLVGFSYCLSTSLDLCFLVYSLDLEFVSATPLRSCYMVWCSVSHRLWLVPLAFFINCSRVFLEYQLIDATMGHFEMF